MCALFRELILFSAFSQDFTAVFSLFCLSSLPLFHTTLFSTLTFTVRSFNKLSFPPSSLHSSSTPQYFFPQTFPRLLCLVVWIWKTLFLATSSFIDLYRVILSVVGKDSFDAPENQTGHKKHTQLLFDLDYFISIQFSAFSNSWRSLNSKHPNLKVSRHLQKSLTACPYLREQRSHC